VDTQYVSSLIRPHATTHAYALPEDVQQVLHAIRRRGTADGASGQSVPHAEAGAAACHGYHFQHAFHGPGVLELRPEEPLEVFLGLLDERDVLLWFANCSRHDACPF
jgi:hypothetical protein